MDMDFAVCCPLVRRRMPHIRFLFIGSRLCSALLSGPASRRSPCTSLSLHFHQVVKRTFTSKLSNMLGTQKRGAAQIRTLSYSGLFYGSGTVSDESKFVHCAVGDPAIFTVPVILESESQKRSTALPLIVERGVLLMDRSMLELLIATKPP